MLRSTAIASRIWLADICFLVDQRCLQSAMTRVVLSAGEARLLAILGGKPPGTTFHRERLVYQMWPGDDAPSPKALDLVMMRLRRKLAQLTDQVKIVTLFGIGYQLTGPDSTLTECPMCGGSLNPMNRNPVT